MRLEIKKIKDHRFILRRPDYTKIHSALDTIRKKCKVSYDDPYEWESKQAIEFNVSTVGVRKDYGIDSEEGNGRQTRSYRLHCSRGILQVRLGPETII